MATFTDCADNLTCATLSGSNGIGVALAVGSPNKIVVSASNVPNSALANSSININGTTIALGATGSISVGVGTVTSVTAGTNLSASGTSTDPVLNLTGNITSGLTSITGLTNVSSNAVTGTNISATNINTATLTGSVSGSSGQFTALTASNISSSTITGSVSGAYGQFVILTGSNIYSNTITGSVSGTNGQLGNATINTLTSTNITASTISGTFSGSGASIINLTASHINNFQQDVRNQFTEGSGIDILLGQISVTNVPNSSLANSGSTIGSTAVVLGTTVPSLTGLTNFSSTTITGTTGITSSLGTFTTLTASNGKILTSLSASQITASFISGTQITGSNISGTNNLIVGGNIGVGTTSPTYKLDVAGTGRFTSNVQITGTLLSSGPIYAPGLELSNSTGFSSIEIGGPNGGYIDLKRPYNDDFDIRLITDNNIVGGGYLLGSSSALLSLSGSGVAVGQYSSAGYKFLVGGTTRLANTVEIGQSGTLSLYDNATQVVVQYPNKQVNFYDSTNLASRMLIDTNGNVGIGTTAPGTELHVQGFSDYRGNAYTIATFAANNTLAPLNIVQSTNGTNPAISAGKNSTGTYGSLELITSESVRATILNNGNVGIGTTSPSEKLEVANTTGFSTIRVTANTTTNTTDEAQLRLYSGLSSHTRLFHRENGTNFGVFHSNSAGAATKFRINDSGMSLMESGGNVGIGTTSPSTNIHIRSTGSSVLFLESDVLNTNPPEANAKILMSQDGGISTANFLMTSASDGQNDLIIGVNSTTSPSMHFALSSSGTAYLTSSMAAKLSILNNGNVGIGTINPSTKLHVSGSEEELGRFEKNVPAEGAHIAYITVQETNGTAFLGSINSTGSFGTITNDPTAIYVNSLPKLVIDTAGKVGINASTPSAQLHVSASSGQLALFEADSTSNNAYISIKESSTEQLVLGHASGIGQIGTLTNTSLYLLTNNSGKVVIDTSGRVGINIIPTTYELQLSTDGAAKLSTNTWTVASDIRVKENILPYTKGLEAIENINPVTYDYNGKAGFKNIKNNIGIIAQDVLQLLPESISTYKAKLNSDDEHETELYNFNSHALTYVMINSIKQLKQENDELKKTLNVILSRLNLLENK